MKKTFMVLLAIVMLVGLLGCPAPYRWVKDNEDYSNLEKDEYECDLQRAQYEQGQGGTKNLGINIAGWKMKEKCMKFRGYIWTNK
jgi:hypothetical protein